MTVPLAWLARRSSCSNSYSRRCSPTCHFEAFPWPAALNFSHQDNWARSPSHRKIGMARYLPLPVWMDVGRWSLHQSARDAILGRSEPTTLSDPLAFLYRDYKPDYFWWDDRDV